MIAAVLRKELHEFIDTIPDQSLAEIKSCIADLYGEDYWKPVLEEASPEETAQIEEGLEEYRKNPASFRLWADIRKEYPKQ